MTTTDSASVDLRSFAGPQTKSSLLTRIGGTLSEWQRRIESRRELACLSGREFQDIGFPAEIEAEKAKPFWRA
jgi:uncharacterized protein YjiS (DUF1127 family)